MFTALGDWALFSLRTLLALRRLPSAAVFLPVAYAVGVQSVAVIAVTGAFIGMVLAVQSYDQFASLGLGTWIGSMTHMSVVRELGPVLAATMLAGRVGGAMAAELGTMRVTEQIDALSCLGVDPVEHLVMPRFLACVSLIPVLTVVADCMGILGSALICLGVYRVEPHYYWSHGDDSLGPWDLFTGLVKPVVFGAFIALISCHRGFHSRGGSEGVGRAATEAFVLSFIAILVVDFFLAMAFNSLHDMIWGPLILVRS